MTWEQKATKIALYGVVVRLGCGKNETTKRWHGVVFGLGRGKIRKSINVDDGLELGLGRGKKTNEKKMAWGVEFGAWDKNPPLIFQYGVELGLGRGKHIKRQELVWSGLGLPK